ncbi:hypothetical protein F5J12DRAFT_780596 [Pisolithus orientalis]|uniref:uncharacterized protein n=1 Tax=Pisolithus orientalis TaxID=936130 RepID=UPI00222489D5|nr:uncharacterized protein F5J12DRAFT_780596 [Pisolithus orientalis]KAI6025797.1 hypothetical protein F5J12DRAFT_780596 [Pisolithus orientalis]
MLGKMLLNLRKGAECLSGPMVGGSVVMGAAAGTYMLVGMIISTGTFDNCKLKCEANGSVVVVTDKFAILGSHRSLLAFLHSFFIADQVFMTSVQTDDTGRGETWVTPKGLFRIPIEEVGFSRASTMNLCVKPKDDGEVVKEVFLPSQKAEVTRPHALHSRVPSWGVRAFSMAHPPGTLGTPKSNNSNLENLPKCETISPYY